LKTGFQREIAAVLFKISRFKEFSNTPFSMALSYPREYELQSAAGWRKAA
jgi:hypothetical protein